MTALHLTDPAWHELVAEAAGATAFHLPAWGGVLAESYAWTRLARQRSWRDRAHTERREVRSRR